HLYSVEDLLSAGIDEHQPVVMTEKDAVKCRSFARSNYWYLSTQVCLPPTFADEFISRVETLV
ncbi:MAG: tetraacyldisaccharide 4'-kinase, partial [Pseudomonadota bacterium]|nr:tetraacyldisaccharide 4'-kinase [Pseudomonadota bacterium]